MPLVHPISHGDQLQPWPGSTPLHHISALKAFGMPFVIISMHVQPRSEPWISQAALGDPLIEPPLLCNFPHTL